ncbi:MAG: enoyl-CoA hydratase [Pseudomonadota bacterium]
MYANANSTTIISAALSVTISAILFATAVIPASPGMFA